MEFTNEIYTKYEKMVYKAAHYYAKLWHMSADDLIGDGMEILFLSVESFDESKGAAFSTHLTYQLKRLNDRAKAWTGKIMEVDVISNPDINKDTDYTGESSFFNAVLNNMDFTVQNIELLDSIATDLSDVAQLYIKDLLNGVFASTAEAHRPTVYPRRKISNMYNITIYAVDQMREELKKWWATYVATTSCELAL